MFLTQKQGIKELDEALHLLEFSRADKVSGLPSGAWRPPLQGGSDSSASFSSLRTDGHYLGAVSFPAEKRADQVRGDHREDVLPHEVGRAKADRPRGHGEWFSGAQVRSGGWCGGTGQTPRMPPVCLRSGGPPLCSISKKIRRAAQLGSQSLLSSAFSMGNLLLYIAYFPASVNQAHTRPIAVACNPKPCSKSDIQTWLAYFSFKIFIYFQVI